MDNSDLLDSANKPGVVESLKCFFSGSDDIIKKPRAYLLTVLSKVCLLYVCLATLTIWGVGFLFPWYALVYGLLGALVLLMIIVFWAVLIESLKVRRVLERLVDNQEKLMEMER
jgi:uncharacterized membrane protein